MYRYLRKNIWNIWDFYVKNSNVFLKEVSWFIDLLSILYIVLFFIIFYSFSYVGIYFFGL